MENILTDLLERTLTVSARKERAARRNKWEQIAPAAIDNWQNLFARRGWHREVNREQNHGGGGGNLQPNSNFSLNMMLGEYPVPLSSNVMGTLIRMSPIPPMQTISAKCARRFAA